MKKKIISVLLAASLAVTFSSCGKSDENTTVVKNSDQSNIEKPFFPDDAHIDIQKCIDSTVEYFTNEKNGFPAMDFSIQAPDEKTNNFTIVMVTNDTIEDKNEYVKLMEKCLEVLNHEASVQDPRITGTNELSYGGLYQKYGFSATATSLGEIISLWSVDQTIEAGSDERLKLNEDKIDLSNFPQ